MFHFTPPPSKSHTNRVLVLAALTEGETVIQNPAICDDTVYMIRALRKLGIKLFEEKNKIIVHGNGGKFKKQNLTLYCGNAGTTFRFLTALSILNEGRIIFTGSKRMLQRPIGELVEALKQLGVELESNDGFPPVVVRGRTFTPRKITINSKISSQFLSALLLIMPILGKDFEIDVTGDIPSKPYIRLTLQTLKNFGVNVKTKNLRSFYINKNLQLKPTKIIIESDASSSTYFFGSAAITNNFIKVYGLNRNTIQADIKFIKALEKMGCYVRWGNNYVILKGSKLKGITIDMNDAPDSVPALAVVSMFAKGRTKIKNIANLRYKESDRISALSNELKKLGVEVIEGEDFIEIFPDDNYTPATIETYNDHRIAMSFAIAKLRIPEIKIKNPDCVKKSFPNFWVEFNKLRDAFKL